MIVDVVMPKMGESINEGTILEWRKEVGEKINLDEILLEIGTDKVDSEIPSSAAGTVIEILAEINDVKEVGEVIARIDTGSSGDELPVEPRHLNDKPAEQEGKLSAPSPKLSTITKTQEDTFQDRKAFYTPVVMKIAAENKISLSEIEQLEGTGRSGRVTKKDILLYLEKKNLKATAHIYEERKVSTPVTGRSEEMHHIRKMISKHMMESLNTSAHVYLMTEVDMTSIVDFVKMKHDQFKESEGYALTYTPFIIESVIKSLKDYPEMNSSISGSKVDYHRNINIGLAVAIENGLMVPSIPNCEEKNFLGICRSVNDIAKRTRDGNVSSDELSGTTFTITNFGVFGVSMGTPIINQPNVGILGVGAIKKQPVVIENSAGDSIAIRSMMILTLGFDHRLIDGSGGSKFLESVRKYIESMELSDIL